MKEQLNDIQNRLSRLRGWFGVSDVAGRHYLYHSAGFHRDEMDEIWSAREDCSLTVGEKTWNTREEVFGAYVLREEEWAEKLYDQLLEKYPELIEAPDKRTLSGFNNYYLTTPYITVSEDGNHARGLFYSSGFWMNWVTFSGKVENRALMQRITIDCVPEDGRWKILHMDIQPELEGTAFGGGFACDLELQQERQKDYPNWWSPTRAPKNIEL